MKTFYKRALVGVAILGLAASTSSAVAATKLPANIAKSGTINIGIDATYSPNEFKDKNGKVIGWEVDLFNAVAKKIGVKTNYVIAGFDTIIAGVKAGKYDVGVSSFTDTKERQASVDFVNYFSAGTQWAVKKGVKLDVNYKKRSTSGFYFLGFIGAAIYFVSSANGFWDGVLGFLKAIVWPAFLVYEAFAKLLG